MKLTPYNTIKPRGKSERREKNAKEAARLPHPCRRKDLVRSDSKRQKDISIGIADLA
jgi:hypothetical protein